VLSTAAGELFPHVKLIVQRAGEYSGLGNMRLQFHQMLYTRVLRDLNLPLSRLR